MIFEKYLNFDSERVFAVPSEEMERVEKIWNAYVDEEVTIDPVKILEHFSKIDLSPAAWSHVCYLVATMAALSKENQSQYIQENLPINAEAPHLASALGLRREQIIAINERVNAVKVKSAEYIPKIFAALVEQGITLQELCILLIMIGGSMEANRQSAASDIFG